MPPHVEAQEGQAHASRQGSVEGGDLAAHVEVNVGDGGDVQQEDQRAGAVRQELSEAQVVQK